MTITKIEGRSQEINMYDSNLDLLHPCTLPHHQVLFEQFGKKLTSLDFMGLRVDREAQSIELYFQTHKCALSEIYRALFFFKLTVNLVLNVEGRADCQFTVSFNFRGLREVEKLRSGIVSTALQQN